MPKCPSCHTPFTPTNAFPWACSHECERDRVEELKSRQRRNLQARARHTLQKAILLGILAPKPCEICNTPNTEAHHDDYSKPLAVRWLCRLHHRQLHRDLTMKRRYPLGKPKPISAKERYRQMAAIIRETS